MMQPLALNTNSKYGWPQIFIVNCKTFPATSKNFPETSKTLPNVKSKAKVRYIVGHIITIYMFFL